MNVQVARAAANIPVMDAMMVFGAPLGSGANVRPEETSENVHMNKHTLMLRS